MSNAFFFDSTTPLVIAVHLDPVVVKRICPRFYYDTCYWGTYTMYAFVLLVCLSYPFFNTLSDFSTVYLGSWFWFDFWLCLTPLSAIFQLYYVDQFEWWKKPEYPERTTDHGQASCKLYHLRLRVECTLFCNLQNRARTHAVLVIALYELLGNPTT